MKHWLNLHCFPLLTFLLFAMPVAAFAARSFLLEKSGTANVRTWGVGSKYTYDSGWRNLHDHETALFLQERIGAQVVIDTNSGDPALILANGERVEFNKNGRGFEQVVSAEGRQLPLFVEVRYK